MKNGDNPIGWEHASPSKGKDNEIFEWNNPGLTKMEFFSALAMHALISNPNIKRPERNSAPIDHEAFAKRALQYANEFLKQLENPIEDGASS